MLIGDIQKRYIVHSNVKARLIRRIYSENGELLEFHQDDLPMNVDNCDNQIMLLWPTLVYHRIDAKSPLWEMSADDLQNEQFEILVMLEGGAESTGLHAQARTSYLPCEILWGHRFQSVLMPKEKKYIEVRSWGSNGHFLLSCGCFFMDVRVENIDGVLRMNKN